MAERVNQGVNEAETTPNFPLLGVNAGYKKAICERLNINHNLSRGHTCHSIDVIFSMTILYRLEYINKSMVCNPRLWS